MWDFSFRRALWLVFQTWPFMILRIIGVVAVLGSFVVVAASGGLIGYELGGYLAKGTGDFPGAFIGLLLGVWLGKSVTKIIGAYVLYMVKAAHVAVLVEFVEGKRIPASAQLAHGRAMVRERFAEANVLFGLDQLITLTLAGVQRITQGFVSGLPIPGLKLLTSFVEAVIAMTVTYVDEIILAHNIRNKVANPWQGGADAMVLYFQNGRTMLRNAFWLTVFLLGFAIVALGLIFYGGATMMEGTDQTTIGLFIFGIIAAFFAVDSAFHETIAIAALLEIYIKVTEGQTPDREWERRIADHAPAFMDLKARAREWDSDVSMPFPGGRTA